MATRSAIGMQLEDGSVRAVYCHWDGYPSHNGKILTNYYDRDKTMQLLQLGDLSSLGAEIGEKHDFDERRDKECTFYGRDRNETGIDAETYVSEVDYVQRFSKGGVDYFYLLVNDDWMVCKYKSKNWEYVDRVLDPESRVTA